MGVRTNRTLTISLGIEDLIHQTKAPIDFGAGASQLIFVDVTMINRKTQGVLPAW